MSYVERLRAYATAIEKRNWFEAGMLAYGLRIEQPDLIQTEEDNEQWCQGVEQQLREVKSPTI